MVAGMCDGQIYLFKVSSDECMVVAGMCDGQIYLFKVSSVPWSANPWERHIIHTNFTLSCTPCPLPCR